MGSLALVCLGVAVAPVIFAGGILVGFIWARLARAAELERDRADAIADAKRCFWHGTAGGAGSN